MGYVVWMLMLFGPGTDEVPARAGRPLKISRRGLYECELLKERIAPEGMCVAVHKFVSPRRMKMIPRAQSAS